MTENTENTLSAYLGPEFQQRLIWQLLVEPEFAEKIIAKLAIEYFDDPNLRRLFVIMLEYYKEFDKVPNLQNQSIHQAINKYKTPNNVIEEESLFAVIKRISLWNERIINKSMLYDGDVVQKSTHDFIKQQEYRKIAEHIQTKVKNGEIKNKHEISAIEDRFQKISHIGEEEDGAKSVGDGLRNALRPEFRQTIPTGIETIDVLTDGGLGKGEIGVVLTPSGVGKAQPLSSKILTPNGWINMGDVKIGCDVVGSDGKSQKVLGVYPQGERDIYKVEFNDGTSTLCDDEHLWAVNSRNNRTANTTIIVNGKRKHIKVPNLTYTPQTLNEIRKNYKIKSGLNYRIPVNNEVEFNKIDLPINPYLLGALIGDGGLTDGGVIITSIDEGIISEITNLVVDDYKQLSVKKISNTISYRITGKAGRKNMLFQQIVDLKLNVRSENKFIPKEYLFTNVDDRISLLQGLMDTDGYASKNGRMQYTTSSKQLSEDFRELVLSLGGFCKIKEKLPKYKYLNEIKEGKLCYILTISFTNSNIKPFRLERKQNRVIYRDKYKSNKYISNIEYSHKEEAQCIYVENDDHLYVTDDYILTHNTTFLTRVANTAFEQEKNVAQIIFEDTDAQIQRKHSVIWGDSSLTKIKDDLDEIERVWKISKAKCDYLEGRGRLIIKRFSQEDTTMKDIRNWMTNYEKKWGFKFDILVLDYLDCVESHKRGQERTEAELTVIKGFETLAADFDIPAWTAIQSNRSGFDAEFVEASQTGGSIKRIQKAHFFMSVAKTPAQKEAHFANIRIIKARFAQDGQTFEDCVFNNDTMKIIIDDPRYRYSKTYKNLKHHDDADIDKLEKKAEGLSKVMIAVGKHDEASSIDRANSETINDLLRQNKEPEDNSDITPQTDFHPEAESHEKQIKEDALTGSTEFQNIENYHISTSRTDLSPDEVKQVLTFVDEVITENEAAKASPLLELDENEDIEILDEGVSDAVNEGVSDAVKSDLLDFSGDTETIIMNEPPEETIGTTLVEPISNIPVPTPYDGLVRTIPLGEEPPKNEPKSDLSDAEEEIARILATDPDAPQGEDQGLQNMLVKKREYQYVKKKE